MQKLSKFFLGLLLIGVLVLSGCASQQTGRVVQQTGSANQQAQPPGNTTLENPNIANPPESPSGSNVADNNSQNQPQSESVPTQPNPEPTPQPSSQRTYEVGEKAVLGDIAFTLKSVDQIDFLGNEYLYETTEGMFYLFELTIENNGNSEKNIFPSSDFVVTDDKGRTYKPDTKLSIYAKTMGFETFSVIEKIPPGIPKTGVFVVEMPKETKGKLKVKPNLFSGVAEFKFS